MRQKLTSRKFLALVTVLVSTTLVMFKADSETVTQVTALITATSAVVSYLFVQGNIDSKK